MEQSWPSGRHLVSLMDSVAGAVAETVELKALRLGREKLDLQIADLQSKRDLIQAQLMTACPHPSDRVYVEEYNVDARTMLYVHCDTCDTQLKRQVRGEKTT